MYSLKEFDLQYLHLISPNQTPNHLPNFGIYFWMTFSFSFLVPWLNFLFFVELFGDFYQQKCCLASFFTHTATCSEVACFLFFDRRSAAFNYPYARIFCVSNYPLTHSAFLAGIHAFIGLQLHPSFYRIQAYFGTLDSCTFDLDHRNFDYYRFSFCFSFSFHLFQQNPFNLHLTLSLLPHNFSSILESLNYLYRFNFFTYTIFIHHSCHL